MSLAALSALILLFPLTLEAVPSFAEVSEDESAVKTMSEEDAQAEEETPEESDEAEEETPQPSETVEEEPPAELEEEPLTKQPDLSKEAAPPVTPMARPTLQCQAGYVYAVSSNGQLQQVGPGNTVTSVGSPASNVNIFNGLGIGGNGDLVYAIERSSSNSSNTSGTVWQFNTSTGSWSSTNKNSGATGTNLVAGAVDLLTDRYYFGGFTSSGVFKIYGYNPDNSTITLKGTVNTPGGGNSQNGDMAFDSSGNLFIVRGTGSTTTVFSVTRENFEAANGGTINAAQSTSVRTMDNVNGVAFDASGKAYLGASTIIRSYDMPGWSNWANKTSNLNDSTDLASCSSPPTITIEKVVEGGRVNQSDQFNLSLKQGDQTIGEATTTGTSNGLQNERVGPLPTVRGVQLTFAETGAGTTDLGNYATRYRCLVDGKQTEQGNATTGTITIPAGGQSVNCSFHNAPLTADITIHKDLLPANSDETVPGEGWSVEAAVSATTGSVTAAPTSPTQETNANGDATWRLRFNSSTSRATVTVSETQQPGYAFERGQCDIMHLDGTESTVQMTGEDGTALTGVQPGDKVACTFVNTEVLGSATWQKVNEGDELLEGSEWLLTGPNGLNETVTDCVASDSGECTGLDTDPAKGKFALQNLQWGDYTLTETRAPEGYSSDATAIAFVIDADHTVVDLGKIVNTPNPGAVTWTKISAAGGERLAGSTWTLTGPGIEDGVTVVDCDEAPCGAAEFTDQDARTGKFKLVGLAWGEYTLTEDTPPPGYEADDTVHTFTIGATELSIDLGDIENDQRDAPILPLTGGIGKDHIYLAGAGVLLLALTAYALAEFRRRKHSHTL